MTTTSVNAQSKTLGDDPRTWTVLWSDPEGNELLESRASHDELPDALVAQLWDTPLDHNLPCVLRGKPGVMRRGQRLFYDPAVSAPIDYPFAGQVLRGHEADAPTATILSLFRRFSPQYNAVLVNDYQAGEVLGAHSDKVQTLCPNTGVISLTVCLPSNTPSRSFKLYCRRTNRLLHSSLTSHRQLLCMRGPTMQQRTKHSVGSGRNRRRNYTGRVHKP